MPEEPPNIRFAKEQGDTITEFCENNYPEQSGQCKAMIADSLQQMPQEAQEAEPSGEHPQQPPQQQQRQDPVEQAIVGNGSGEMDAIVADCLGSGFLGLHRPNMKSCMKAVAKHERERE